MKSKYLYLCFIPMFLNGATYSLTVVMSTTPPTINATISEKTQTLLSKLEKVNSDYKNKTKPEIEKKQIQTNTIRNLEREILVELRNIIFNKEIMIKINSTPEGTRK